MVGRRYPGIGRRPSAFEHLRSALTFSVRLVLLPWRLVFVLAAVTACAGHRADVPRVGGRRHRRRLRPPGSQADRQPHARDFVVRDNGVEQVVDSLGTTDSAHVIIGLDLSGSVDGRTLEQLRAGVRALVGELTPQDRVSLFTFSDRLRLLMRAGPPGGDLEATLARFEASGATPLHDAIVFGSALSFADQRPRCSCSSPMARTRRAGRRPRAPSRSCVAPTSSSSPSAPACRQR